MSFLFTGTVKKWCRKQEWHNSVSGIDKRTTMEEKEPRETERARPSDEGRRNDPNIRDESAPQPGVNTISSSKYDDDNQRTTKSSADGYKTPFGSDADKAFDDPGSGAEGK
jgi:hypothetical protein